MNEFGSYIKRIRDSKGLSLNQVALYSDISAAQLSRIENGKRGVPKPATIKKIADALKVDYEELMRVAGHIPDITGAPLPALTKKEEKDIAKDLEKMLNDLDGNDGYSHFNGEPIDEEDKELLRISLENSMRLAKQMAKKKFTPKKYKKND
jgi:HTH-type transcriptional regulator, competence development regulator